MLLAHLVSGRYGDHAVDPGPHTPMKRQSLFLKVLRALLLGKKT